MDRPAAWDGYDWEGDQPLAWWEVVLVLVLILASAAISTVLIVLALLAVVS